MKRKAGRKAKNNSVQVAPNLSTDTIGATDGISKDTVKRFIRLTYLIPPMLDMVDSEAKNNWDQLGPNSRSAEILAFGRSSCLLN